MARSRKTKENDLQLGLFDLTLYLRTAPCVPALRKLVSEWRENGYQGITRTTRTLLNYWFFTDINCRMGSSSSTWMLNVRR